MTARLIGTGGEEIVLEISPREVSSNEPNVDYWGISAALTMAGCFPAIQQCVNTCFYQLPSLEPLANLLAGDSSSRFVLDEIQFSLEIFEHSLNNGPRSGYVAACTISSLAVQSLNWPNAVADQLLQEHRLGAAAMNFAFLAEYEPLKAFHRELQIDLRRIQS